MSARIIKSPSYVSPWWRSKGIGQKVEPGRIDLARLVAAGSLKPMPRLNAPSGTVFQCQRRK